MDALRKWWFLPVPAVFYLLTTAPGVGHSDQAIIISAMFHGSVGSAAKFHNITFLSGYVFAHLLPFDELAYRCNLVSTFYGTLTVFLFYLLALRLTKSVLLSTFSALFLMISHSMWWHSTIAEVYAVNAFFCVAILYCLVLYDETSTSKWLYAAAALAGLSIFNHPQMGMWIPALGVVLLLARKSADATWRSWSSLALKTGLSFLIGFVPYIAVFIKDTFAGGNVGSTVYGAMGSDFVHIFFFVSSLTELWNALANTAPLFILQWGWPSIFYIYILLGIYWLLASRELSTVAVAAGVAFLVNTVFFTFYPTWDKFAFLLPSFIILSFVGLLGLRYFWTAFVRNRKAFVVCFSLVNAFCYLYPIYFFEKLPNIAATSDFWSKYRVNDQTRTHIEDGEFLANPNKRNYTVTDDFANALFDGLPPNSVFVDHISRTYYQLTYYYQQFHNTRRDVQILLFMPTNPVASASEWPGAMGKDELVDYIVESPSLDKIFLPAYYGYAEVTRELLDKRITFVEYPLNDDWTVIRPQHGSSVDSRDLVDELVVGINLEKETDRMPGESFRQEDSRRIGTLIRFKENNPPAVLRLDWTDPSQGTTFSSPLMYVPYNCNPLHVPFQDLFTNAEPETQQGLSRGDWRVNLYAFDALALSTSFQIE
ncbi:MAG: hypothetical protein BMS9Abin37_2250 [Acidobacteriota bacterium]|nr:MAG: hypothetical protein BMS9Abin37_2250 [Acidobacteriota bacterium]